MLLGVLELDAARPGDREIDDWHEAGDEFIISCLRGGLTSPKSAYPTWDIQHSRKKTPLIVARPGLVTERLSN